MIAAHTPFAVVGAHWAWTIGSSVGALAAGFFVVYAGVAVISIVAAVKVVTKAGYSGWWVLVAFVPVVGFVMMLVFAFSRWPVLQELQSLRAQIGGTYRAGPWGGGPPGGLTGGFGADSPSGFGGAPSGFGGPPAGAAARYGSFGAEASSPAPAGDVAAWSGPEATEVAPPLPRFDTVIPSTRSAPAANAPPSGGETTGGKADRSPEGAAPSGQPPAGWYPTPDGRRRYWDGSTWTDHYA